MEKENLINKAIVKNLGLWWTDETRNQIKTEYTPSILEEIEKICSYAAEGVNGWAEHDDIEACRLTAIELKNKYPYLSDEAIVRVTNMAAYYWK